MKKARCGISSIGLIIVLCMLALKSTQVFAQTPVSVSDDDVNRIASQLYCPVCENVTLDVCPTEGCARWREMVRGKLALGWTDQQVMDFFVTQYGASVIGIPPKAGISILLYVIPPVAAVFLMVGGFFIVRKYRSAKSVTVKPVTEMAAHSESYRKRLRDDIGKDIE